LKNLYFWTKISLIFWCDFSLRSSFNMNEIWKNDKKNCYLSTYINLKEKYFSNYIFFLCFRVFLCIFIWNVYSVHSQPPKRAYFILFTKAQEINSKLERKTTRMLKRFLESEKMDVSSLAWSGFPPFRK
jgi:hypothetical protein